MSMKLQYVASSGNTYDLRTRKFIRTREANFHAWTWNPVGTELQYGLRVANFSKEAAVYTAVLVFEGSPLQRKTTIEDLHEDFEADIRNQTPGKIVWGDYYVDCYITESSTTPDERPVWTDNEISIYCPYPFWVKENTKSFFAQTTPGAETFLDYEFDYDYDYAFGTPGISVWQTGFPFTSKFKMTIFGPAVNPRVLINNHPYQINVTLEETEYLILDSRDNTITRYLITGQPVNIFDLRDKEYSVFEPIQGGNIMFNWSGAFGFDLTLFEERSEPRWTT